MISYNPSTAALFLTDLVVVQGVTVQGTSHPGIFGMPAIRRTI